MPKYPMFIRSYNDCVSDGVTIGHGQTVYYWKKKILNAKWKRDIASDPPYQTGWQSRWVYYDWILAVELFFFSLSPPIPHRSPRVHVFSFTPLYCYYFISIGRRRTVFDLRGLISPLTAGLLLLSLLLFVRGDEHNENNIRVSKC